MFKEEVFENLLNLALKNCESNLPISPISPISHNKIKPSSFISIGSNAVSTDCGKSEFGCCGGSCTARVDISGSNCTPSCIPGDLPGGGGTHDDCSKTEYGCCPKSCTARLNINGSNCKFNSTDPRRPGPICKN